MGSTTETAGTSTTSLRTPPSPPLSTTLGTPTTSTPRRKVLSRSTVAPALLRTSYAVRGPLAILADKLAAELGAAREDSRERERQVVEARGWRDVVSTNIGNPQALGQVPVSFFRQVGRPTRGINTLTLT